MNTATRNGHDGKPGARYSVRAEKPPTPEEMIRWFTAILDPGQVVELRAVKVRDGRDGIEKTLGACSFLFAATQVGAMVDKALELSGRSQGVYFTLNPVKPELKRTAQDRDILVRRILLIDVDPRRLKDTSSTDDEKAAAHAVALAIRDHLRAEGWPEPILADSANGWHLLYRIDLAAGDQGLAKRCLQALAKRFDTDAVEVDRKVFNPSRITKFYGTTPHKGEPTAERPHRQALIVELPQGWAEKPVPGELLETLADSLAMSVEDRAILWLAKCEVSVSGHAGHAKLLWAAKVGPAFNLSKDDTFRLLRDHYNPRCAQDDRWSDKELWHKVDEAFRLEPRRGWMLDDDRSKSNGKATEGANGSPPRVGIFAPDDGASPERPVIVITTEEHQVVDQVVAALSAEPTVYQRLNVLMTVLRDSAKAKKRSPVRPAGTPRIVPLPMPRLRELMAKRAAWIKRRTTRNGDAIDIPAHPPDWAVAEVAARGEWPRIRPLEGIVEAPTIRPDGSLLDRPGWDEATGLLYEPNAEFPPIPRKPSQADARAAADELLALVADFPFADDNHRMAWLVALLTPLARFAIDGPCPLFLFDANTSGAGKGKLCHLIAAIATGRPMACADYPDKEEEMAKQITAIALAADRMILFDNVTTGFSIGGKSLDRALTAPTVKGRILGRSEMTGDLPMNTVFYATGNNLGLKGDALRRIVPCRLESPEVRPEERADFTIKGDLVAYAITHRPRLVRAAMTLLRAYVVAGRPDPGLTPMDYPAWCGLVRNAVHWTTGVDPCETRRELVANDPESTALAELVRSWKALCDDEAAEALTAREALKSLESNPSRHQELREILSGWSKDGSLPTAHVIGKRLGKVRRKPTEAGSLDFAVQRGDRNWFVRPPKPSSDGGDGGDGDSKNNPSRENLSDKRNTNLGEKDGDESHHRHHRHHSAEGRERFEL